MSKPGFARAAKPKTKNKEALKTAIVTALKPTSVRFSEDEAGFLADMITQIQVQTGRKVTATILMRAALNKHMNKDGDWFTRALNDLSVARPEIVKSTSMRFAESETIFMNGIINEIQEARGKKISATLFMRALLNKVTTKDADWFIKSVNDLPLL